MRANIEDTDLSSYKLRLATAYFDESSIKVSTEHVVLGVMVKIWYYSVNEKKKKISLSDISKYLLLVNRDSAKRLAECLVAAEYLLYDPDEDAYEVLGKDKDFAQKLENEESSRTANEAKRKRHSSVQMNSNVTNCAKKRPSTVPSAVPHAVPLMVPSAEPSTVPHAVHAVHAVHAKHTDQVNTNKTIADFSDEKKTGLNEQVVQESASQILSGEESFKKSSDEKKEHKQQEEKIYSLRKAYERFYREKLLIDENDPELKKKMPIWGAQERTMAKKLIREKGVETTIELLEYYFRWQNKQVVDAGYPFASGWSAFGVKINELCADIADHGSRKSSRILDFNAKQRGLEEKQKLESEYIIRQLELDRQAKITQ